MKKQLLTFVLSFTLIGAMNAQTLWDIISGSPDHETLTAALEAAGLDAALDTDDFVDFTIWAPTDAAFDALPDGLLDDLLADPEGELTNILTYHVTTTTVFASGLADGQTWPTLQGSDVTISIVGDNIFVDDAQVVAPFNLDGESGGVVHSIDAVMLPPVEPCTDYASGPWGDFNIQFGGAPSSVNGECETHQLGFGAWASESYIVVGFVEGVEYTFSICDGPEAGSWDSELTVLDLDGNIVASAEDCEITWTSPACGAFIIGIQEVGFCDDESPNTNVDNGNPTLSCTGVILENSIADVVTNSPDHTTLLDLVVQAELAQVLSDPACFTLFAPNDAAFAEVPGEILDDLLADPTGALAEVLLYHVVPSVAFSGDLTDGMEIETVIGQTLTVSLDGDNVFINGIQVIAADLPADNGVVHVLGGVLLPEDEPCTDFAAGPFIDFNSQFDGAPVPDEDGECPVNQITGFEAWASESYIIENFIEGVEYTFSICEGPGAGSWEPELSVLTTDGELLFQVQDCEITWVSPGSGDYIIGIQEAGFCGTESPNLQTNNGFPTLTCTGESAIPATVVDIIVNSPDHTTLASLVVAANLVETLSSAGPFTVFAPTDAAFGDVDPAVLDDLAADPEGLLTDVLTYHVAPLLAFSTDLSDGQIVPTVFGEDLTIGVGANVTVGNDLVTAIVTVPDLEAENGVVHVIDAVLLPTTLNVEQMAELESLRIFPNPTANQFTVNMDLSTANRVTIDLVNLLGQQVWSKDYGQRSSGKNLEMIDVSALPTGFYLMNITIGESQVVTKVQVMR